MTTTRAILSTSLVCLLGAGCASLPGLDIPELTVRPQYHALRLDGKARMQSAPGGGPLSNNAAVDIKDFGTRKRDDDYGGTLAYGDGFSGFEFSYLNVDMDSTERAVTTADYGAIPAGTTVHSAFFLEEFRLSYLGQLFEYETDGEILLRFGVGPLLAHREGKYEVREDGTALTQVTRFGDDGVAYGAARLRAEYRNVYLQADYAWSDFDFGGDFEGPLQDYSVTGSYLLEDQDMRFFAGYRWVDLPISGTANSFAYDQDFQLEGFVFGIEVRF